MKLNKLFLPTITLMMPISIFSCNPITINYINNDNIDSSLNELKYTNYFNNNEKPGIKEKNDIKEKITNIINKYRLWEWNIYYEKHETNIKSKSKVLNISWSDYQNFANFQSKNKIFEKYDDINITNLYKNQDEQFQYFNDFINIINEENSKNEEDFLYLRWLYYSIDASNLYKSIQYNGKPIYEVDISDWSEAIASAMPPKFDFKKIKDLISAFLKYYGVDEKTITNILDYVITNFFPKNINLPNPSNSKIEINLVNNSIIHLYLCSKDLVMRLSTKTDEEINKNLLWKLKAQRIKKMNEITKEKYNLLTNSFVTKKEKNGIQNISNDEQAFLNKIKDFLQMLIDETIARLVNVKIAEYSNENQIIKGGIE